MKPLGKNFLLQLEDPDSAGTFVTVANSRSHTASLNNEPIDVTDKDGMPWRELLEGGVRSYDITAAGVFSDAETVEEMEEAAFAGSILQFRMIDGLGTIIQGYFQVQSMEHAGEYNKEQTYSFKLASSGTVTRTPAA